MASSGTDAIGEVEAAASSKKNRRRISDYLGDSDGGDASPPPQLRLPRFTCARFRFVRLGRRRDGRNAKVAAKKTDDAAADPAAGSKPPAATSPSGGGAAAEAGGMGLSMLLLLLARTCVELNRMAEVRAQMEALLKEIRDEAGRMKASAHHHAAAVDTPRTFNLQLSSTTATVSSSSCTSDTDTNHHQHHAATTATEEIARRECETESKPAEEDEERRAGVDQLEAVEFEAAEPAPNRPNIECDTEGDESSGEEFIELDRGRFGVVFNGDIKWDATGDDGGDSGEESTTCEQDCGGGGVSGVELERRLHELLHRRNRDRIEELESALRKAEQKLREKEMEARLWQDTATLVLQPPPPRDGVGEGEQLAVEAGLELV